MNPEELPLASRKVEDNFPKLGSGWVKTASLQTGPCIMGLVLLHTDTRMCKISEGKQGGHLSMLNFMCGFLRSLRKATDRPHLLLQAWLDHEPRA